MVIPYLNVLFARSLGMNQEIIILNVQDAKFQIFLRGIVSIKNKRQPNEANFSKENYGDQLFLLLHEYTIRITRYLISRH